MKARLDIRANPRIREIDKLMDFTKDEADTVLRSIDVLFRKNERQLFSTQGASGGPRWDELSPGYKKYKRKVRPGRKILTFDGKLRDSLKNKGGDHVARHYRKPRLTFVLGTRDRKAAYHGPARNNPLRNSLIPVRDPMQHTEGQERELINVIMTYIAKTKIPRYRRQLAQFFRARGLR